MRARIALAIAAMAMFAVAGCGKQKKAAIPAGPPRPPAFAGSYVQSCRNITSLDGGFITAECADTQGHFDVSYIKAAACKGDIGNQNGMLTCNGAVATTTPPPPAPASDAAPSDAAVSSAAAAAPPAKP
jgi:hypothetical protein